MGCILRLWGEHFDVDGCIGQTRLPIDRSWRRGERKLIRLRGQSQEHEDSGFNVHVSAANELAQQVSDALTFLRQYEREIRQVARTAGVFDMYLDFGVFWRSDSAAQSSRFPPDLLALVGGLGIWLEVSHYAVGEAEESASAAEQRAEPDDRRMA